MFTRCTMEEHVPEKSNVPNNPRSVTPPVVVVLPRTRVVK